MKRIPPFETEKAERAFWESKATDSTHYLDWGKAKLAVFPNLKPSTTAISLRLPDHLLSSIKAEANQMDVPYQSLMKLWLSEKLEEKTQHPKPWQTV